jgi:hypothetical protein
MPREGPQPAAEAPRRSETHVQEVILRLSKANKFFDCSPPSNNRCPPCSHAAFPTPFCPMPHPCSYSRSLTEREVLSLAAFPAVWSVRALPLQKVQLQRVLVPARRAVFNWGDSTPG